MEEFYLDTFLIYLGILLVGALNAYLYTRATSKIGKQGYMLMLFLTLFIPAAIRYDVGSDFLLYESFYNYYLQGIENAKEIEFGYKQLNLALVHLGFEFQAVIVLTSFLTLFFSFRTILENSKELLVVSIILYLSTFNLVSYNAVRQCLAVSFAFYGVLKMTQHKYMPFFFYVVLGSLFHLSVLLLLPFYFIRNAKFNGQSLSLIVLIYYIASLFADPTKSVIQNVPAWVPYSHYVGGIFDVESEISTGLGVIGNILIGVVVLFNGNRIISKYPQVKMFLFLYFAYLISQIFASEIRIFTRLKYLFGFSIILVLPYYFKSIEERWVRILNQILMTTFFILIYLTLIIRVPEIHDFIPYQTFFEK